MKYSIPLLFFLSLGCISCFLFPPTTLVTAGSSGSIIFNELMYNPIGTDTNREWIELWNTSSENIDMESWKLCEINANNNNNINHTLKIYQGSFLLPPNEYAIFVASGSLFLTDYPDFSGTIIDTSFSLINTGSGETISLKNSSGSLVDTLYYNSTMGADGNGKSLEKNIEGVLLESTENKGTPGRINSVWEQSNENTNTNDNFNTNTNLNANNNTNNDYQKGDILINEFFPEPQTQSGEQEWIELYNTTNLPIDLSLLTIEDSLASPKTLSGTILPLSYIVLEPSPIALNNSGDTVLLRTKQGTILDQVAYGATGSGAIAPPGVGKSLGRYPNGVDTDHNNDFRSFGIPTKGTENIPPANNIYAIIRVQSPYKTTGKTPFTVNVTGEDSTDDTNDIDRYFWDFGDGFSFVGMNPLSHTYTSPGTYTITLTITDSWNAFKKDFMTITVEDATLSGNAPYNAKKEQCSVVDTADFIYINEIHPNPIAADEEHEFIELVNKGDRSVQLCGWVLDDKRDGGSKPYTLPSIEIYPGEYKIFKRPEIKIALNNDTDDVYLFDPTGKEIDHIAYEKVVEGKSYSSIVDKNWVWQDPTPGQSNDIPFIEHGIFLNEIYLEGEDAFVELISTGTGSVTLSNWYLLNSYGEQFDISGERVLSEQELTVVPIGTSQKIKTKTKETWYLYDGRHQLQDKIIVDNKDNSGQSYSRLVYQQFVVWERTPQTRGDQNKRDPLYITITPEETSCDKSCKIAFRASTPAAKVFYTKALKAKDPFREYIKPFTIKDTTTIWYFAVLDGIRTKTKSINYTVHASGATIPQVVTIPSGVYISEIYGNPPGNDEGKEWLELYNDTEEYQDLSLYRLINKKKEEYIFPMGTVLSPKEYKTILLQNVSFMVANKNEEITILSHKSDIVDTVYCVYIYTDQSCVRQKDGITTVTDFPTPGIPNSFYTLTTIKKDKDRDLLDDEEEKKYQTNSALFDTDGDLLPDGFEVLIQSNPLIVDSTVDKVDKYKTYLSSFFTLQMKYVSSKMTLYGKSYPESTIVLTIADEKGKQMYQTNDVISSGGLFNTKIPQPLMKGRYTVTAIITDKQGVKSVLSQPFFLEIDRFYPGYKTASQKNKKSRKASVQTVIPAIREMEGGGYLVHSLEDEMQQGSFVATSSVWSEYITTSAMLFLLGVGLSVWNVRITE